MIYVFLADGFEECEAIAPIDMLKRAELDVETVKIAHESKAAEAETDMIVTGAHDIRVKANIFESEIDFEKISMIVLPGGGIGVENLYNSPTVKKAVTYCVENNLPIGAICAAPSILARLGYLSGRTAVAYPLFKHYLFENGAVLPESSKVKVVTDGIFTTAEAAGVSIEFALELVKVMKGKDIANKIAESIVKC